MLIHDKMDLGALAVLMGPAADRVDAFHMREALMVCWEGFTTEQIAPAVWKSAVAGSLAERVRVDAAIRRVQKGARP